MDVQRVLYIGNKNYSSWSLRPWLLLKQAGIEFQERRLAIFSDEFRDVIGRLSPAGRVPVLKDGDLVIWDSLAICEYIAEQYPHSHAWPEAVAARAHARAICAEMHSGFPALRNHMPMDCRNRDLAGSVVIEGKLAGETQRIREMWRECREKYAGDGPFLFGHFSIADCMYAPVVFRFRTYLPPLGDLEQAYCHTLLALPAMREWLEASELETETIDYSNITV